MTLGGLSLDLDEKQLTVDGAPVRLTATEYRIVALLMQNPGPAFTTRRRSTNGCGTSLASAWKTP